MEFWPALSREYGLFPWHVGALSHAELIQYVERLGRG